MARIEGFQEFIAEIGRHVPKSGIITFTSERGGTQKWDVGKREDGGLVFGVNRFQSALFPARFLGVMSEERRTGLILRTFTAEKDEPTGRPVKELRGYLVFMAEDGKLRFRQLSAQEVAEASTTHHVSGKFLAPERGVVYCGPDDERLDDNLDPVPR